MERVVARETVKTPDLYEFERAIRAIVLAARAEYETWQGMKATNINDVDEMPVHSFELVEETLSDGSKALSVRVLFVGDVGHE